MNTTSRIFILIGLVLLLGIVMTLSGTFKPLTPAPDFTPPITNPPVNNLPDGPVACTMDAKMCPDGSYVGRVGPNCEFAACPAGTPSGSNTFETRLGQPGSIANVSVTPIEILEDSRCPIDVVCIQAGTVRVKTLLSTSSGTNDQIFTLNQPVAVGTNIIELIQVTPIKRSTVTVEREEYKFIFRVTKK